MLDVAARKAREAAVRALGTERFDLLVVGGGITGAALAHLASRSQPGLRIALIEARDLAAGTSSRSSRLLHGGLRYLTQGRLGLVRRLLQGKRSFARLAPHLVHRTRFLLPIDDHTPHSPFALGAALRTYAALAGSRDLAPEWSLDGAEARAREPLLNGRKLRSALAYDDVAVHDARLVAALACGAEAAGATVVTRLACRAVIRAGAQVTGVTATDELTGASLRIDARVVIDPRLPHVRAELAALHAPRPHRQENAA